ncbi:O-acetyl-ADP-ribose deacetylase (regulator of RNase III), contains Macro domain [Marinitoga hydrogenitolerans DSM 16785]|uniref:O-acetyl-ADP-ribose deacetylase (Regulator of RNase III), contains Macro domain n=1 Tax=Marinitoga hydrogenitolerans (strain DSM 16785 / JCM 12826 / AT1271) TaxID=1122195 RepID=A0A1M4S5S1_MARH1|nr:macro domain-containing protein [Marinitoga hydrogenitolerans]SHE27545.1 O-acetyl-ADP-ribose deacetylase (regulator of RNase III), contains Macro domain [Marinitoga hydrogenitolerans DSM 16785]
MNKEIFERKINKVIFKIVIGDLTKENVDVIVNAANSYLAHGGGVAAAIVKAGGYQIQKESDDYIRKNGIIKTGEVGVTSGGNLKAKYIIHAVGPVWNGSNNNEEKLLYNAIYNSLKKADDLKLKTISFPAISTGIFGYPFEKACEVYIKAIEEFSKKAKNLSEIRFCFLDKNRAFLLKEIIGGRYGNFKDT